MTSRKAAAGITRSSARSTRRPSAWNKGSGATRPASWRGWCAIISSCPSLRRRRTSAIRTSFTSFARRVGDQAHLDYLYVLTVADVRGTNPKLWNAWKARLFEEFYERTKRALRRGLETPVDQDELIRETQADRARKNPGARARAHLAGLVAVDRGVFSEIYARGDRLADRPPRRPAARRRLAAGRRPAARRARRHGGAHLHPAARAQLRPHHRAARPDGTQRRRCAPHHERQRVHIGDLRGSRGQRRGDRRLRPHPRDRARLGARPAAGARRRSP